MLKQRKSIVGLDIGSSSIKALEITQEKYDFIITAYGQIDIPGEQATRDAISDLFRGSGFHTKRVASSVSGKSVIFRFINMVKMSDDDLTNAIRFEADKYIPFDVDEVQIDIQKLMDIGAGDRRRAGGGQGPPRRREEVDRRGSGDEMLTDLGLQPVIGGGGQLRDRERLRAERHGQPRSQRESTTRCADRHRLEQVVHQHHAEQRHVLRA